MVASNFASLAERDKTAARERLAALSIPEPNSGCLLWLGRVDRGYGKIEFRGANWIAHRLSWCAHRGNISGGLFVCHKCDVRACVNPDHLFLGTPAENSADMVRKGRAPSGTRHYRTSLTENDVRYILRSPLGRRQLAKQFNLDEKNIGDIKSGAIWRHIWESEPDKRIAPASERVLTAEQVAYIRGPGIDQKAVALALGVGRTTVRNARSRKTYRHLP